jgi:hypothetical protein
MSIFYTELIIYTLLWVILLMISNSYLIKKIYKLGINVDEANHTLTKNFEEEIDILSNGIVKLKEEQSESMIHLKSEIDKLNNALSSKLIPINTLCKEINIRIDGITDFLNKKIENLNDKTLTSITFKQEEYMIYFKNELDKVRTSLLSKSCIDTNNLEKKIKSKIDYDKAFGLYQECPDKLEARHYVGLLKTFDRRRDATFDNIIKTFMNKFSVMTVRRDHEISGVIKFLKNNKIKTIANSYGPLVFDFSKELCQIKKDIIETYPLNDEDKKWLNVNVFEKL